MSIRFAVVFFRIAGEISQYSVTLVIQKSQMPFRLLVRLVDELLEL